ncbi:MAG TPA: M14 family zinc carboxypeptidase, partial [Bacteroidales bacterium]|nr:M14 family zinc carboxypeptidase [Bacteroidales bacterium]
MTKQLVFFLTILLLLPLMALNQTLLPPPLQHDFLKLTSYDELSSYINEVSKTSGRMKVEIIGQSVKGRNLYAVTFSEKEFAIDQNKLRVLLFAQQHGNEQSGKEGMLLLIHELLKPENRYLFEKIDLALIPQINPDGGEMNTRRNANKVDLNRNHMILTEPETIALHSFFDRYLFEATLDVHEYSPYGEPWEHYGYRKNSDITMGAATNLNVALAIRDLSNQELLPFVFNYLKERKFSAFTYCPGGPPEESYIRHSTFDVNDGRQSLGIQNTFSFIQEGMNGKDDSIENIRHRSEGQMTGMRGMLEYCFRNAGKIKTLVSESRKLLTEPPVPTMVSIQSIHKSNGSILPLPLYSYATGKDTVVNVKDYRPVVASLTDTEKPEAYLIPADCTLLTDWVKRQSLKQIPYIYNPGDRIQQYHIGVIDSIDFEGDRIVNP